MNRQSIRVLFSTFKYCGIILVGENKFYWSLIYIFSVMSVLVGCLSVIVHAILSSHDILELMLSMFFASSATSVLIIMLILYIYRQKIGQMLIAMDKNIYVYPDEQLVTVRYEWYLREKNIVKFMSLLMTFQYCFLILAWVPGLYDVIAYGDTKRLLFPGWFPWKSMYCTIVIELLMGANAIWYYCTSLNCIILTTMEFMRQFERLRIAIISLKERALRFTENQIETKYEKILRINIIHCIKHHQMLLKNFSLLKTWFALIFSLELTSASLTFALGLYSVLNVNNVGVLVNFIGAVSIVFINLFTKCMVGEIFFDLNDSLRNTMMYEFQWFEESLENQRLYVMFHQLCDKPFELLGFKIIRICRYTFARISRTIYSYFNVLNISVEKR